MPNLGTSEQLLSAGQENKISWAQFEREYRKELFLDGPNDKRVSWTIKNHGQKLTLRLMEEVSQRGLVTLLCHCDEDQPRCHRRLLQKLILSNRA